jgi:hypothetical protein
MAAPDVHVMASSGLLALALVFLAAGLCVILARTRTAAAEHEMRESWEREVAGVTLPDYDGSTYDWPETGLASYLASFDASETRPIMHLREPVPPSTVSGPMPTQPLPQEYDPAADAQAYIAKMASDTTAFLAQLGAAK